MDRKNWQTISDPAICRGTAAWQWFLHYSVNALGQKGVRLAYGNFSQMAKAGSVLKNTINGFTGLCLGNAVWGALFWPLVELVDADGNICFALDHSGSACWQFLYSPDEWTVVLTHVTWEDDSVIYLGVTGEEVLLKHFLREPQHARAAFHNKIADLALLSERLFIPPTYGDANLIKKLPDKDLLMSLIQFAADGDADYIAACEEKLRKPSTSKAPASDESDDILAGPGNKWADDGLGDALDELVLTDLNIEDRQDFKPVAEAVLRKHQEEWSLVNVKLKERKPKAKAKGKPKAKAQSDKRRVPVRHGRFARGMKRKAQLALQAPVPLLTNGRSVNLFVVSFE